MTVSNADFCCAENFPVLIPYRDLVKIVEVAKNLERYEKCLSRTNEQLVALRSQYTELCEKVREMDKLDGLRTMFNELLVQFGEVKREVKGR